MKFQQRFPGSTPRIPCTSSLPNAHSSRTLPTLLIAYLTFLAVTPGMHRKSSSAAAFTPAPTSGSSSAPIAIAREGSGSGLFALRSLNMSAVAYGEDDQMMRKRGKWSVSKTSLDWIEGGARSDSVDVPAFLGGCLAECLAYALAASETACMCDGWFVQVGANGKDKPRARMLCFLQTR